MLSLLQYNSLPPLNPSRCFPSCSRMSPRSTLPAAAEFVRRLAHARARSLLLPGCRTSSAPAPPHPTRTDGHHAVRHPLPLLPTQGARRLGTAHISLSILPRLPVTDNFNGTHVLPPPCLHLLPQRAPKTVPAAALHLYMHLDRFKDLLRRGSPLEQVPAGAAGVRSQRLPVGSHTLLGEEVDAMICSTILPSKMQ
jgi:hypothetical protein